MSNNEPDPSKDVESVQCENDPDELPVTVADGWLKRPEAEWPDFETYQTTETNEFGVSCEGIHVYRLQDEYRIEHVVGEIVDRVPLSTMAAAHESDPEVAALRVEQAMQGEDIDDRF